LRGCETTNRLFGLFGTEMKKLSINEIEQVDGAGVLGQAGAALGGAAAVAGGLAMVPTPASGALGAFAVVSGVLGAALSYVDAK
jgi:hypothetical protein